MSAYTPRRGAAVRVVPPLVAMLLIGCSSGSDWTASPDRGPALSRGAGGGTREAAETPASTVIDARPVAMVDGRAVTWGQLRPALDEIAAGVALEEMVLDRRLAGALDEAGVTVTGEDVAAERRLLLETLHEDPNVALRLLDEVRARQGLGPTRFDGFLRRQASLRALVRDEVVLGEAQLRQAFERRHGARRQARIILVPNLDAAQDALAEIRAGRPFAEVAVEHSTDRSAARGGLLEPIALADPTWPDALRQALWALAPGAVSTPILVERQYAVVELVREVPPDSVFFEEVRDEIERLARLERERLAMETLARRLVGSTTVTIFDEGARWSWSRRGGALGATAMGADPR